MRQHIRREEAVSLELCGSALFSSRDLVTMRDVWEQTATEHRNLDTQTSERLIE